MPPLTISEALKASEHIPNRIILINPHDIGDVLLTLYRANVEVYLSLKQQRGTFKLMGKDTYEANKGSF